MKRALCFLILLALPSFGLAAPKSFINGLTHGGDDLTCDLPGSQHIQNIGSKRDGSGMCVFSSIEMAARFAGLEQMRGWRDWCAAKYDGGGWPEKVDKCLADWFQEKGIEPIKYVQFEGKDPKPILKLCEKTGRPFGMTYGYSPRYGQYIQHMVLGVMYREDKFGVVLDNNFIGEDRYEWIVPQEFVRRTIVPNRSAWIFVWLPPPPPPSPRNLVKKVSE